MSSDEEDAVLKSIMTRLSSKEKAVLSKLLNSAQRSDRVTSDSEQTAPPVKAIKLDKSAFNRRGTSIEKIRICVDFGTAMSKAWATGRNHSEPLPLLIGKAAGQEGLTVASSIFISDEGRIFFGSEAERQHRVDVRPGRARFDNLKRMLSEAPVGTDLSAFPVRNGIDPTNSGLTGGDLLLLYLAWLTDLTETALEQAITATQGKFSSKKIDVRAVARRFAIPCFESVDGKDGQERSKWARGVMADAMLRAQVLADTLHGRWRQITTHSVAPIIKECHKLDTSKLSYLMPEDCAIREPIAAGASRFDAALGPETEAKKAPTRQLLLVVDAGAGTTDFALFQAITPVGHTSPQYGLLKRSVKMSRIAGNEIDRILRPTILRACGVDSKKLSQDDLAYAEMDLDSRIRDIKLALFDRRTITVDLRPHFSGPVSLADLLANDEMKKDGAELLQIRLEILTNLYTQDDIDALRLAGGNSFQVYVLLTGGSASIPIIQDLAKGTVNVGGANFRCTLVDRLPDWISRLPRDVAQAVANVYPQSAVAIGGSARHLPKELTDLELPITPAQKGPRKLERYQVSGT